MENQRILAIGYAREGFGFGRVLQSLLQRLCHIYDVHQFEMTCTGNTQWPWHVYANQIPTDRFGEQQLPQLVEAVQPDFILLVAELWDVPRYVRLFRQSASHIPLVAYCPLDGELKPYPYLETLAELSLLVVYTEFARQEVSQAFAQLSQNGRNLTPPALAVIPHGVDTERFYPYHADFKTARQIARTRLFPTQPELDNAFIVFNGNRNQSRKRIDLTLKGFSLFAVDKPDTVKLYLHMGLMDQGVNVMGLAKQYGIQSRLICTTQGRSHPVVSDAELNLIYNACDVGLNSSMGEGWGLVSFEHGATGAAQVVPYHSACQELWPGAALMLETKLAPSRTLPLTLREVSPEDIAQALQRLYSAPPLWDLLARGAYRNATQPNLQWQAVAEQFDRMFQTLMVDRSVPYAA
ncbi:glycosyltransferase family 1 protein [Synechococcales cyanobacterium C]|uniref:Glycosyltransferase family 1 protein n=1 Tax=Petrachloros mirabilis ULC683 TaxID=2781853 RepID=A0A8K1ZZN2_9CYAN|nr:glycosyltransferase [Petrachloros mirabilis]NCJ07773.1 glycosyltransferase family 1 protein [Petrachloros mirabilis ULC683]